MNAHTSFHSIGELDQLRELVYGVSLSVLQLQPGILKGAVCSVDLGSSTIHWNWGSLPTRARGGYTSDRWTFTLPTAGMEGLINGRRMSPRSMFAFSPNSDFEATTFNRHDQWSFTIKFKELARVCQALSQRECLFLSSRVALLQPDPARLERLRSFATATTSLAKESPGLLNDARIRETLHARLAELLAQAVLSASSVPSRRGKQDSHWRIVRTAEEFVHASLDVTGHRRRW